MLAESAVIAADALAGGVGLVSIDLENDVAKHLGTRARIDDDHFVTVPVRVIGMLPFHHRSGSETREIGERLANLSRDDAAGRSFGLIGDQNHIEIRKVFAQRMYDLRLELRIQRNSIDKIQTGKILGAGGCVEQFRVGESGNQGRTDEQMGGNESRGERAFELPAESIVADYTEHGHAPHAQSREVRGDGSGGAGRDFGGGDGDARDAGFTRGLSEPGMIGAPTIETYVADHQGAHGGQSGEDGRDVHSALRIVSADATARAQWRDDRRRNRSSRRRLSRCEPAWSYADGKTSRARISAARGGNREWAPGRRRRW